MAGPTQPSVSALSAIAKFIVYRAICLTLPARLWIPTCRKLASIGFTLRPGRRHGDMKWTAGVLGRKIAPEEAVDIELEKSACAFATAVLTLGQKYAKGRTLVTHVQGLEHLEVAKAAGKGVILWVCPFAYARLVAKVGLAREGVELFHLSRFSHGFGKSPFAEKHLNPKWAYGENLYLRERLVIGPGNEVAPLRALHTHLKDNRVISITFGIDAKKVVKVPFLSGELTAAAGPPGLALSTGASILPVYALRRDSGEFDVTIDRPLNIPTDGDKASKIEHVVAEIAQRLGPMVDENPGQWGNWNLFQPPDAS